jgi:hypothetical protein
MTLLWHNGTEGVANNPVGRDHHSRILAEVDARRGDVGKRWGVKDAALLRRTVLGTFAKAVRSGSDEWIGAGKVWMAEKCRAEK